MKTTIEKLEKLHPCQPGLDWAAEQPNAATAWDTCKRGDWMLWLLGKTCGSPRSKSRKTLVLAACECARLALKFIPENEKRPLAAIETAEKWAKGNATLAEVKKAVYAAYDAAYAAYAAYAAAAAYAAYAAAYTAYAAYAAAYTAADATTRAETLEQCADIVRKFYPKPPKL